MLHVIIQKPFDENKCAHYTVGDLAITQVNPGLVQSVVADGPELRYIYSCYHGIRKLYPHNKALSDDPNDPNSPKEIQWFGDDAKFIVANWL